LRQRTDGSRIFNLGIHHARRRGSTVANPLRPGRKDHVASAPLHQAEPFGQRRTALRHGGDTFAISNQLVRYAAIMERVRKAVRVIELLGHRNRLRKDIVRAVAVAGQMQRIAALCVRADAGIVAAEHMAEVAVTLHVVHLNAATAVIKSCRNIASEKRCGPAAVIGFEQQIAVGGSLGEDDKFIRPIVRQGGLTFEIGIEP
jgi:hypothetical protein